MDLQVLLQVQGDYYGDAAARLGYFPSSIVREDLILKPAKIDMKTDVSILWWRWEWGGEGSFIFSPVNEKKLCLLLLVIYIYIFFSFLRQSVYPGWPQNY